MLSELGTIFINNIVIVLLRYLQSQSNRTGGDVEGNSCCDNMGVEVVGVPNPKSGARNVGQRTKKKASEEEAGQ